MIIRVPPQHKMFTWAVGLGGGTVLFSFAPKEDLPDLLEAMIRFCLDPHPNDRPFLA